MNTIVIAPDSFKESLNAEKTARCIADGVRKVFPDLNIIQVPMSDGGEGLVHTLVTATGGQTIECTVTGPLGENVTSFYGILGDGKTAVIEMAAASGLPLIPLTRRNPLYTSTYGTGELIRLALDSGCRKVIVGIGGSATNDGGAGMAQALGARLLTARGGAIKAGAIGLEQLDSIDLCQLDARIKETEFVVAVDVDNPLCGPQGASYIYGPQKGADAAMLPRLDGILKHYARVIKRDVGSDVAAIPGAGAAGGLGAGMVAFLGARLSPGVEVVLEVVKLERILAQGVDLVITGEGEINHQTACGKVPVGVARLAKKYGIPVIALAGSVGDRAAAVLETGIDAYFSIISKPMTLAAAMKDVEILLTDTAEQCMRLLRVFL